jgi:hypothetical protein
VGRARPYAASTNLEFHPFSRATSVPSGHTAAKHWASDVLIGGLIGHFSARWVGRELGF